ncbi:MAG TPA: hypothetical protein DCG47_08465 [Spirochaetaceae bacterium]|nr:hypothetical protein [Spirochaetaceae bacterium]
MSEPIVETDARYEAGIENALNAIEAPVSVEKLEELEELEEFEAPADVDLPEAGEALASDDEEQAVWGSLSAEALALASQEEDDLPIIPESLGLELVEETNLSDIMGYMDARPMEAPVVNDELELSDEQRSRDRLEELEFDEAPLEPMVFASPFDALADGDLHIPADNQIDIQSLVAPPETQAAVNQEPSLQQSDSGTPEGRSVEPATVMPEEAAELEACDDMGQESDECLDELEFELFLECLDLSGLNGYRDEEGFLEIDDASYFNNYDGVDELAVKAEEAIDDAIKLDEAGVALLSDEDRERIEELQVMVEEDDGLAALELESLDGIGYVGNYVPIRRAATPYRLSPEELIAIEDAEPGALLSLDEARESSDVIDMIDGVFVLNREALHDAVPADPALKALADEVLRGPFDKR